MMAMHVSGPTNSSYTADTQRDNASTPMNDDVFQPSPGFLFEDAYMHDMTSDDLHQNGASDPRSRLQAESGPAPGQSGFDGRNSQREAERKQASQVSDGQRAAYDVHRIPPNLKTWAGQQAANHAHVPTTQSTIALARAHSVSERFGMITPPDGTGSQITSSRPSQKLAPTWSNSSDRSDKARKAANKRHSKEKLMRESINASELDPMVEGEVETEEKKEHYREKNKIAAAKCRNKKRKFNDEIETQARDLECANKTLKAELMELRNVALMLKDQILKHSPQDCHCKPLHDYSMAQATRMLQNSSMQRMADNSMMPQFSHPHHAPTRTHSIMSTSSCGPLGTSAENQRMWGSMSEGAHGVMMAGDGPAFSSHQFVSPHPQYMTEDEMHSVHSATVSPVEMTGFGGQHDFEAGSGGDMFHETPFSRPWEFSQQS